jgi:hypothetical protein
VSEHFDEAMDIDGAIEYVVSHGDNYSANVDMVMFVYLLEMRWSCLLANHHGQSIKTKMSHHLGFDIAIVLLLT